MGALLRHLDFKLHPLSNHHVIVIHELGDSHWGLWGPQIGAQGLSMLCIIFYTFTQHR